MVAAALLVGELHVFNAAEGLKFFDPLEQNLVIGGLCHQDKGHGMGFERVDERLIRIKAIAGDHYL